MLRHGVLPLRQDCCGSSPPTLGVILHQLMSAAVVYWPKLPTLSDPDTPDFARVPATPRFPRTMIAARTPLRQKISCLPIATPSRSLIQAGFKRDAFTMHVGPPRQANRVRNERLTSYVPVQT